jgi:hypothetical protein
MRVWQSEREYRTATVQMVGGERSRRSRTTLTFFLLCVGVKRQRKQKSFEVVKVEHGRGRM